jgi:MFS family permease
LSRVFDTKQPPGAVTARSRRTVIASLGLFQAVNGATWSCYLAFAGILFEQKFDLPIAQIAVLVSSCFLAYCVIQSLVSVVLDAGIQLAGLWWMLLRSPLAYCLGLILLIEAPSPLAAVGALGVIGLGAASGPIVLAILFEATSGQRSGFAASLLGVSYLIGQIGALSIGWYVVGHMTVRVAFTIICISWFVLAGLLTLTMRVHRAKGPSGAQVGAWHRQVVESFRRMGKLLIDPRTRALKVLMLVAGVAPALAGIYLPLYLLSVVTDSTRSAGYIATSTAIGYAVVGTSTPAVGAFADRRHNHRELLLGVLVFTAMILITIAHVHDPLVVSGLSIVMTIAGQWLSMLQNAILLLEVSPDTSNTFFAVNQLPFYVGSPVALSLGLGITAVTGSIANTLFFVAGLFAAGALVWALHLLQVRPRNSALGG